MPQSFCSPGFLLWVLPTLKTWPSALFYLNSKPLLRRAQNILRASNIIAVLKTNKPISHLFPWLKRLLLVGHTTFQTSIPRQIYYSNHIFPKSIPFPNLALLLKEKKKSLKVSTIHSPLFKNYNFCQFDLQVLICYWWQ